MEYTKAKENLVWTNSHFHFWKK